MSSSCFLGEFYEDNMTKNVGLKKDIKSYRFYINGFDEKHF